MTKCIVLGEDNQEKKLKPIEFVWVDSGEINGNREKEIIKPHTFRNIELVSRSSDKNEYYDIMFAYDNDRSVGSIFYGWWNDGVAE